VSIVVDIQTVSIAIASAGVFLAAIYYIFQIRHQSKTRQMGLLMNLYLTWGSDDMKRATGRFLAIEVKDYDDFVKKHGPMITLEPDRSQIWNDIDRIGWFFNGIGFLVHGRFVDIRLVDDLVGYGIVEAWEKMKLLVYGWRKQYNIPKSFRWFEYLANEMQKREQRLEKGVTSG
jgi:hypothetical protein